MGHASCGLVYDRLVEVQCVCFGFFVCVTDLRTMRSKLGPCTANLDQHKLDKSQRLP